MCWRASVWNKRPWVRFALASVFLAALAVLVGCYPSHELSTFDPAGKIARDQLTLFYWVFWASVFVFVAVEGVLIYAIYS